MIGIVSKCRRFWTECCSLIRETWQTMQGSFFRKGVLSIVAVRVSWCRGSMMCLGKQKQKVITG